MSGYLKINSNIASLGAQRQLAQTSRHLGQTFQRLSSGLRINSASDDAAGLAVASSLAADARVFGQGIRNLNDGISALHIASGAVDQLNSILIRVKELAEQAANGTLSTKQRRPLDAEANALLNEYNRIIGTTQYNSRQLFDASNTSLDLQVGYGTTGSLSLTLGDGIKRNVVNLAGTPTAGFYTAGTGPGQVAAGDLNGDGLADLVTTDFNAAAGVSVSVLIGNGDGSFRARTSYTTGAGPYGIQMADMNHDGSLDLVATTIAGLGANILLNNGNGTFRAAVSVPGVNLQAAIADFNGDGAIDIVTANGGVGLATHLNNGDGTFKAAFLGGIGSTISSFFESADFNNDGFEDIFAINSSTTTGQVFLGNGTGQFKSPNLLTTGTGPLDTDFGDINHDGYLDIVVSNTTSGSIGIYRGNGDGTFSAAATITGLTTVRNVTVTDFTGDGKLDIYATQLSGGAFALSGNDDGTFKFSTGAVPAGAVGLAMADFSGDDVVDAAIADNTGNRVLIVVSATTASSTMPQVNLMSSQSALLAFEQIDAGMRRVATEIGKLGSAESRAESTAAVLRQIKENYETAASQIMDADIAQESSVLVRAKILQQAGAAVLAQANQQPQMALTLLRN